MAEFGAFGAQELASGRNVVEEITDFDSGAARMRLWRGVADAAAFDLQRSTVFAVRTSRGEREAADGSNGWQGLAPEPKRSDRLQVIQRCDLARGVARDGQRQVDRGDAVAVVAHADQAHAAFLEIDVDPARTRIQRVLDQFLDHGCRTFDDLAGRDLVDEGVRKLADRHGGRRLDGAL